MWNDRVNYKLCTKNRKNNKKNIKNSQNIIDKFGIYDILTIEHKKCSGL